MQPTFSGRLEFQVLSVLTFAYMLICVHICMYAKRVRFLSVSSAQSFFLPVQFAKMMHAKNNLKISSFEKVDSLNLEIEITYAVCKQVYLSRTITFVRRKL